MKKIILALPLFLVLLFCSDVSALAQDNKNQDTVTMKKSDLTPDQLAKIQKDQTVGDINKRIETYGKWVGMGKEIGEAVDSSLGAITNQADHFAHTGVGKLTVALVIWKVVGDQAVHIVAGIIEVLIFLPLWIWSYRKFCFAHRVLVKKEAGFFGAKQWEVVSNLDRDHSITKEEALTAHLVSIGIIGIVLLFTVFSY